jgi:hypothetical protein
VDVSIVHYGDKLKTSWPMILCISRLPQGNETIPEEEYAGEGDESCLANESEILLSGRKKIAMPGYSFSTATMRQDRKLFLTAKPLAKCGID